MTGEYSLLVRELARAARSPRLLVAADFDGTIAPLVDDPLVARAAPGAIEAMEGLAAVPLTFVAVLSGRGREDLVARVGPVRRLRLLGSHGCEDGFDPPTKLRDRERLDAIAHQLDLLSARFDGAWVERKPLSVAFHVRRVAPEARLASLSDARALVRQDDGLSELSGKAVLEVSTIRLSKAQTMAHMISESQPDAVVYLGDDDADEAVFETMPSDVLTLKVGDGPTAARHRVAAPTDAATCLRVLEQHRRALNPL